MIFASDGTAMDLLQNMFGTVLNDAAPAADALAPESQKSVQAPFTHRGQLLSTSFPLSVLILHPLFVLPVRIRHILNPPGPIGAARCSCREASRLRIGGFASALRSSANSGPRWISSSRLSEGVAIGVAAGRIRGGGEGRIGLSVRHCAYIWVVVELYSR